MSRLLDIKSLSADTIKKYLDGIKSFQFDDSLKGKTVINMFLEDSTRTRVSFEIAAKRLGANFINVDRNFSSLNKGEDILDTFKVFECYSPTVFVVRHFENEGVRFLADKIDVDFINAGDGCNEHPTQAFADALTIMQKFENFSGLKIAICGDLLHSRVARSNYHLLTKLGVEVRFVGPKVFLPSKDEFPEAIFYESMEEGLSGVDIVMMLRVQKERFSQNSIPTDYYENYSLKKVDEKVLVLHPGPVGKEIGGDIGKSGIYSQVRNGLIVRGYFLSLDN